MSGRGRLSTEELLYPTAAAHYAVVSRSTLWRWVRDGRIKPVLIGGRKFFLKSEIDVVNYDH
ncbi:MAG TPA: helix-turn-helix domain-containing protein [Dehalococcoidales bacterium]|nr:helix-turn-helix domain-containing protein [Dehalococcoidales bacterium]